MTQFDTSRILLVVFDRLYVLRNQLVHGGATEQLDQPGAGQDGAAVLGWLLPVFIDIMLENPDPGLGEAVLLRSSGRPSTSEFLEGTGCNVMWR
jgi:hypothetical protein